MGAETCICRFTRKKLGFVVSGERRERERGLWVEGLPYGHFLTTPLRFHRLLPPPRLQCTPASPTPPIRGGSKEGTKTGRDSGGREGGRPPAPALPPSPAAASRRPARSHRQPRNSGAEPTAPPHTRIESTQQPTSGEPLSEPLRAFQYFRRAPSSTDCLRPKRASSNQVTAEQRRRQPDRAAVERARAGERRRLTPLRASSWEDAPGFL